MWKLGKGGGMGSFEYLVILLVFLLVAAGLELYYHIHLYRSRKERLKLIALLFLVGVAWDSFAIWRGHWYFPRDHNLGVVVGLMPIEEYLFILIIPYFIITLYRVIHGRRRMRKN